MEKIQETAKNLRDGQILKVYFDEIGKEETADGSKERAGIYPRGAEEGYLDETGGDGTKRR